MDIKEAAQKLDTSDATIRRLIKAGKLDADMVNGKYDISEDAISQYRMSDEGSSQSHQGDQIDDKIDRDDHSLDQLLAENDQLKVAINQLHNRLSHVEQIMDQRQKHYDEMVKTLNKQKEESRLRQDTIIIQLARQLDQARRKPTGDQQPWYRRKLRKRNIASEPQRKA